MTDVSRESLLILVALIPGFLSVKVRDFFLPRTKSDPFDRSFEVIAFAVLNYLLAGAVYVGLSTIFLGRSLSQAITSVWPERSGGASLAVLLYLLAANALLLGVCAGVVASRDLHYRAARKLRLTTRTGRPEVWQDVFADIRGEWHVVHLADGRRAMGFARYYSDHGEAPSLFLRSAHWIADDGRRTPIEGEGLLVGEAAGIQCIEFLHGGRT